MQRPDNELQMRIKECANPTFGYRRGEDGEIEKDIFDGEPLPAGWVGSPAEVDEVAGVVSLSFSTKSAPVLPGAAPVEDDARSLFKPYEDHKFNALKSEYKRRTGKGAKTGTNKVTLIQMLADLDALNQ
jgi:hypothetical protein